MLPKVVDDLLQRRIAQETEGAIGVFLSDKEGEPPALIRYRSGAYTYTTTDLATIQYRAKEWKPETVLYVVGVSQALHFKQLFAIAQRWGYSASFQHIGFGSVLKRNEDGTVEMFGTRKGGAAELGDLLDRSVQEAARRYEESRRERIERGEEVPELTPEELRNLYEVVGLGAVKYADLSQSRETDYIFDWDKMLAMNGNTATYMQYAYARNCGIFRKGDEDPAPLRKQPPPVYLEQPEERALALQLLRFPEALHAAAADYRPNLITAYLWDLAKTYSGFFQRCSVLKADTPLLRQSRLLLCDLTARIIQKGLDLLGIKTIERM
jgi:arginyl-tRNA synthetase